VIAVIGFSVISSIKLIFLSDWKHQYARQDVILNYMQEVADKYDFHSKIRLEHKVKRLFWMEGQCQWEVTVEDLMTGLEFKKAL
jgi:cation diffusion facilitator CzcD-associated flavoprotein CzcO